MAELLFRLISGLFLFLYMQLGRLICHLFGIKPDSNPTRSIGVARALGFILFMLVFCFLPMILFVWFMYTSVVRA